MTVGRHAKSHARFLRRKDAVCPQAHLKLIAGWSFSVCSLMSQNVKMMCKDEGKNEKTVKR